MDKKAEGSYFLLVAIVAIVAVAGIVVMMLGAKTPVADTSGEAIVAARNVAGEAIGGASGRDVIANSCDADNVCEVAKTVSTRAGSTSALILTSDIKKVLVDGSLSANLLSSNTLKSLGNLLIGATPTGGGPEQEGQIGRITLDPSSDVVVSSDMTVQGLLQASFLEASLLKSNALKSEGNLLIGATPTEGDPDQEYQIGRITLNPGSDVIVTSDMSVQGSLQASLLKSTALYGQGNAYACLDPSGALFRSNTPCR